MKFTKLIFLVSLFAFVSCSTQKSLPTKQADLSKQRDSFVSLAYVALSMLHFDNNNVEGVDSLLNQYRWEGITDISLIGGIYLAGRDGSLVTQWNQDSWPLPFEGVDYLGKPFNEKGKRGKLYSKPVVQAVVSYFKNKGMKMWLSQNAAGWLLGGSLGIVVEDQNKIDLYADNLERLAHSFGFDGIDFDWEFPPNEKQAIGYRELMKSMKNKGFEVSVCAISPTVTKDQLAANPDLKDFNNNNAGKYMRWDEVIDDQMVDQINVMGYLGYDKEAKQMDVKIKKESMSRWERVFPQEFTSNQRVKFLSGIGFYSYLIPGSTEKDLPRNMNFSKLYENYGYEGLTQRVIDNTYTVWTTDDVAKLVRLAKDNGWNGIFTWLVTHDVDKTFPDKYSRQKALSEAVHKIWNE